MHSPTFSEMRDYLKVTSNQTVADIISALERDGYIEKAKGKLRGMILTEKGFGYDQTLTLDKPKIESDLHTVPQSNASTSQMPTLPPVLPKVNSIAVTNTIIPTSKGGEFDGSS